MLRLGRGASPKVPGGVGADWGRLTRHFTHLSQAIDEIVNARVWSGIHFRTADVQGQRIGRRIASYREQRYFRPE